MELHEMAVLAEKRGERDLARILHEAASEPPVEPRRYFCYETLVRVVGPVRGSQGAIEN